MSRIRVMIVDDHLVVREGLKQLLELEDGIEVVGEAGSGLACLEMAEEQKRHPKIPEKTGLTQRELEVLQCMVGGLTDRLFSCDSEYPDLTKRLGQGHGDIGGADSSQQVVRSEGP